jgi:hypothetical protein
VLWCWQYLTLAAGSLWWWQYLTLAAGSLWCWQYLTLAVGFLVRLFINLRGAEAVSVATPRNQDHEIVKLSDKLDVS